MKRTKNDLDLWENLAFKTTIYRKNYDLTMKHEHFITEYDGVINKLNIKENKSPTLIGEFGFSVWNVGLARKFGIKLDTLLNKFDETGGYIELGKLIKRKKTSINDLDKVIIIHTYVLHPDYKKMGITDEFMEFMYRDFYIEKNSKLFAYIIPMQDNKSDWEFYKSQPIFKYYSLEELLESKDSELNEYKLFSRFQKTGFIRINNSHIFEFEPDTIIKRLSKKLSQQY